MVDVVYIAACAYDARWARICIASVRRFYPDVPIRLLPGGKLSPTLVRESKHHWNVDVAKILPGDYGWGFVKLEALFGPPGERFLVLDSDTVITGPVLDMWTSSDAPFLVNDEKPSVAEMAVHYEFEKVRQLDPDAREPQFIFNSGQWFGTAGVLTRADFVPWLEWTMPRRLRYPESFKNGEQGVLNYVLNRKAALDGLRVDRRKIMLWPGRGMQELTADALSGGAAPAIVVHWAGIKKSRHRDIVGSDLLDCFEREYYRKIPAGKLQNMLAIAAQVGVRWRRLLGMTIVLTYQKWIVTRFWNNRVLRKARKPAA